MMTMMIPANTRTAEAAALEIGKKLGLENPEVISKEVMQEAEGTRIEIARIAFAFNSTAASTSFSTGTEVPR